MAYCAESSEEDEEEGLGPGREGGGPQEGYSSVREGGGPHQVILTRRFFDAHRGTATFDSWEQLVSAVSMEEEGEEKDNLQDDLRGSFGLDPMQIFGCVATLLIEACVWGVVGYYMIKNVKVGLVLTVLYGIGLLVVVYFLPSKLAGMVWPNIPCVIGAIGVLLAVLMKGPDVFDASRESAGLILLVCILPQTLAAAAWMYKVPEDPDRSSLFSNLFLGLWAAVQAFFIMVMGKVDLTDSYWRWYYFSSWTLLLQSVACIALSRYLLTIRSRWSSAELISWTLNLGALGLAVSVSGLLHVPTTNEFWRWLIYSSLIPILILLGIVFGRAVPTMLGGICCLIVTIRLSVCVGDKAGTPLAAFGTFGACGAVVLAIAAGLRQRHSSNYRPQSTAAG